jgi:outer membrane protein assembly factor BamB
MLTTLILCAALAADPVAADSVPQWPAFLGVGASEVDPETIPIEWSPEKNIAWQAEIPGHGQSSPVIRGDQVFVTSVEGPNKETLHVVCYSLADGKPLWDAKHASTAPQKNSLYISRAAPTPVVDDGRIYAYFESGDVVALDFDGKEVWSRSLAKEYGEPKNEFGLAASPLLTEDAVVILIDDLGPSYLVALDRATGEPKWRTERTSRSSWSSPMLVPIAGEKHIVVSSAGSVDGYDPKTGEQLWSVAGTIGGNTSSSPKPIGQGQFLVGASVGREAENAEGARQSNGVVQIAKGNDGWTANFLWRTEDAQPTFASPMVYDGYAYWINRVGAVYCYDVSTGKEQYVERLAESSWATPLGIGDRVYFFGKNVVTTVIKAGPEFEKLAENRLWPEDAPPKDDSLAESEETDPQRQAGAATFAGTTQYGVAAVDGSLLIRTGTMLYCVRKE